MAWKKIKLSEILKNREGRYRPNDSSIAGLKRIHKINFSGQIFLSNKGSNTDMICIKKGDLVISGINVEKGALAVYEEDEDILATIHYSSYIFDPNKIDIDFLKVFLRSPDFVRLLKEQVPGGIKTEIKPKHILSLEVYFPETTKEQKKIAQHFFEKEEKLNQLDKHITYQTTQLENLNQAILQEAVQGKLVAQNPDDEPACELLKRIKAKKALSGKKEKPLSPIKPEEIPFNIPKNWTWCRLGEIANHSLGKMLDVNKNKGEFKPYLRNINVQWFNIDLLDLKQMKFLDNENEKYSAMKGDILICEGGYPGRAAIWEGSDSIMFQKALHRVRFINQALDAKLFVYYLWLINSGDFFKSYLTGSGIQHFTGKKLNVLPVPLPPLIEQKRIVVEIEKQFAKTKQLKENIVANQQATEQLLKALLHQAFEVKEDKVKTVQQAKGKVIKLDTNAPVNWDNLVAEPFKKIAAHPVNNIQNIDWEMAMMVACMKNKLGVTYGDVGLQKNVYNTNNLQPIFSKQYTFANSNFGTYCHELKDDLKRNPFLITQKVANKKEVYTVNPKYSEQVLDKLSAPENKEFIQAINRMLSIYEHPFINKETDKIELYNTVLKVALDKNTRDIGSIYQGMKDWKINQTKYKTKAEKFNKPDTTTMLKLLTDKRIL